MNRVVIHNTLEPTLSFSSSANRIVIHHNESILTRTGSNQISVKNKITKKVKMFFADIRITVKQRDDKKNVKAVR